MRNYRLSLIAERSALANATGLHIFDFDDTLYASPPQPKDWAGTEREWWRSPASLSPPYVPAGSEAKRQLPSTKAARASLRNPQVYTVLLTGRVDDPGMRMRIAHITKALGLDFDELLLKPSGNTEQFKAQAVDNLLQRMPQVQSVAMWDDLARNLNAVEKVVAAEGLGFQRNLIRSAHSFAEQRQACFDTISSRPSPDRVQSDEPLSENTMSYFADFNRLAHGRALPSLQEAVAPDMLTEADASKLLRSLVEGVGYELHGATLDETLDSFAAFVESAEFDALSEEEKSKVKAGFKMVFGKLRKLGQNIKAAGKELATNQNSRQMLKDYVRSGEAKKDAKAAIGKKANAAMNALDKKLGGKISKGTEKLGAWLDKKTDGKFGKAIGKMQSKAYDKRQAKDAEIKAYYKKSADKQAEKFRAEYEKSRAAKKESVSNRMASLLAESEDAVAMTIVKQMGGMGKLKVMLGVKQIVTMPNGVKIMFPNKQRSKGNAVVVTLEPSDTYKMEFFNGAKSVKVYDDVYSDKLKEIFEKQTGLYLSL